MPGDEALRVVPAAHVAARSRESGALAVDLEDPVLVEREEVSVDAAVVVGEWACGECDLRVREFTELASRRCGDSPRGGQCGDSGNKGAAI
jgi:hypothetical protein